MARPAFNGPPGPGTLALMNDTLGPSGSFVAQQIDPMSMALDPQNGLLYVTGGFGTVVQRAFYPNGTGLLVAVDPTLGSVVDSFQLPGCYVTPSVMALAFDPNDGLLLVLCANNTVDAVAPGNGTILETFSLPEFASGPYCWPGAAGPASIVVASSLNEIFVLGSGCVSTSFGNQWPDVVTVLRDDPLAISTHYVVSPNGWGWYNLADAESIAVNPAADLLYVDTDHAEVSVIAPDSGVVLGTVALPFGGFQTFLSPLTYVPDIGEVVTEGVQMTQLPVVSLYNAQILGFSSATTRTTVLANWTLNYTYNSSVAYPAESSGPWPQWLAAGGIPGADLTVVGDRYGGSTLNAGGSLVELALTDRTVLTRWPMGGASQAVVAPDSSSIYLLDPPNARVVRVGTQPLGVLGASSVGTLAYATALDPGNGTLFVATGGLCGYYIYSYYPVTGTACVNQSLEILPSTTHREERSWPLPPGLTAAMAFDTANQELYVLTFCSYWLTTGGLVNGIPCLPHNATAALTAFTLNGSEVAQEPLAIPTPPNIFLDDLAVDPAAGVLAVTSESPHGGVVLLATDAGLTNVSAPVSLVYPGGPAGITFDPNDNLLLASVFGRVFNGTTFVTGRWLFAFNATTGASVYSSLLPGGSIAGPGSVTFDSANDTAYVAVVTAVDAVHASNGSLLYALPVPFNTTTGLGGAYVVQYDGSNGELYALGTNLTIFDVGSTNASSTVPGIVPGMFVFPGQPVPRLEIDPTFGEAVVVQPYFGSATFVAGVGPPRFELSLSATGLPRNVPWSAEVGGITERGVGNLTFFLPNGTYSYSISSNPGFLLQSSNRSGNVTINGSSVAGPNVVFRTVLYSVDFVETGPASPAGWTVCVSSSTGRLPSACSPAGPNTTSRSFSLPNGTYSYLLESLGSGYVVTGRSPVGSVVVAGGSLNLTFSVNPATTVRLFVRALGLPNGTRWCATLAALLTECSTARKIFFGNLTPGVYAYNVSPVSGFTAHRTSGSVNATAPGRGATVGFRLAVYTVRFWQVGLPSSVPWKLTLGATGRFVWGPSMKFRLADGSYSYQFRPVPGYTINGTGTVTVNGTNVTVVGVYVPVLYAVTFTEVGLASGQTWSVHIGGAFYYSNATTSVIYLPNGSFRYTVGSAFAYSGSGTPDPVRVRAAPTTVTVHFV